MVESKKYYLDLLFILTKKEFKAKYKSTILGFLWIIINPLVQMVVFSIVFGFIIKIKIDNYPFFVFAGLFPWMVFQSSLFSGVSSILNNRDIIKKVNFPRSSVVLASLISQYLPFVFIYLLFVLVSVFLFGLKFEIVFIPLLLIIQFLLSVGVSLILSSLDVYYRDVSYILQSLMTVIFYLNPIFYSLDFIPEKIMGFYILNPLVGLIVNYQAAVLPGRDFYLIPFLISFLYALVLFLFGIFLFKKRAKFFADWV